MTRVLQKLPLFVFTHMFHICCNSIIGDEVHRDKVFREKITFLYIRVLENCSSINEVQRLLISCVIQASYCQTYILQRVLQTCYLVINHSAHKYFMLDAIKKILVILGQSFHEIKSIYEIILTNSFNVLNIIFDTLVLHILYLILNQIRFISQHQEKSN